MELKYDLNEKENGETLQSYERAGISRYAEENRKHKTKLINGIHCYLCVFQ